MELDNILIIILLILGFCIGLLVSAYYHEFYIYPKICEYLNSTYFHTLDFELYCLKDNLLIKVI
jgi:hypothetical protein